MRLFTLPILNFLRSQNRLWLRQGVADEEEEEFFMHFFQTKNFVPPW